MEVQPIPARGLLHRDGDALGSPASDWPDLMGRMDGVDEYDRLVGVHRVEQAFVTVNESLLFGVVEAARHGFRLAIVETQTMQQDNQPRAAVGLRKRPRQPGADQPRAAWQLGANPIAQRGLLLGGQTAAAAFMAEALQPLDPASLISDASDNATRPRPSGGPIDDGVDCLTVSQPMARSRGRSRNQPEICSASIGEPITHETDVKSVLSFEDRFTPPAQLIGSGGVKRRIASNYSLRKRGYDHHAIAESGDSEVAEQFIPMIHLVFSNLRPGSTASTTA